MRSHRRAKKEVLIKTTAGKTVRTGNSLAFGILKNTELDEIKRKKPIREKAIEEKRYTTYFIAEDLDNPAESYPITKTETKKSITAYRIDVQTRPLIENHMKAQKSKNKRQTEINVDFIREFEVNNSMPAVTTNYVIRDLVREHGWKFDPPRGNKTITKTINQLRKSI